MNQGNQAFFVGAILNAVGIPHAPAEEELLWPDKVDSTITAVYLMLMFGIPLLGYFFMVLDFRKYLRSLRRALVVVKQILPSTPYWALKDRPSCLKAFDLELPCTEEELLAAYRDRAKSLHPDHGGDLQQFLRLQKNFEQALQLIRGKNNQQPACESAE